VAQRYGGMNAEEHPLLQLPKDKQRDLANLVESDELNEVAEKTGYSRRQILGLLASLGAGAAVGGFSVNELVGVVEAAADTADSDGNVGLPGDRVDVFAEGIDASGEIGAGSVSTGQADITNETLLSVTMSSDLALSPASNTTVTFDTVAKDERNEFDAGTHQFTPDNTGWYWVSWSLRFSNVTDTDRLRSRFQENAAADVLIFAGQSASATDNHAVGGTRLVNLSSGTAYEITAEDTDSSADIDSADSWSYLTIRRAFR